MLTKFVSLCLGALVAAESNTYNRSPFAHKIMKITESLSVRGFFGQGDIMGLYDNESLLMAESVAVGAGTYEGTDIEGFYVLQEEALEPGYTINLSEVVLDPERNTGILKTDVSGVFKKTGKQFSTTLVHIFEVDPQTRIVRFHVIIDENKEEVSEIYNTRSTNLLKDLYWSYFEASSRGDNVQDLSHPLWQDKIADDIRIRMHLDPARVVPGRVGTTWTGKEEVLEGMKAVMQLHMEKSKGTNASKKQQDMYDSFQLRILYDDDETVWVGMMCGKEDNPKLHGLVKYTFKTEDQGKLSAEEIWVAKPIYPWDVYGMPGAEPKEGMSLGVFSMNVDTLNVVMDDDFFENDDDDDDDDEDDDENDDDDDKIGASIGQNYIRYGNDMGGFGRN